LDSGFIVLIDEPRIKAIEAIIKTGKKTAKIQFRLISAGIDYPIAKTSNLLANS